MADKKYSITTSPACLGSQPLGILRAAALSTIMLGLTAQVPVMGKEPAVESRDAALTDDASAALEKQLADEISAAKKIDAGADPKAYLAAYEQALATALKIYPEPDPELEIIRSEIGFANFMLGNADQALAALVHAIPIFEASLPKYEAQLFEAYNNLAVVNGLLGRHKDARVYIAKAVEKWRETAGEEGSVDLGLGLSNIAMTDRALGNFEQALEENRQSIAMLERLYARDKDKRAADSLVVALGNLPLHQGDVGDFDGALASTRSLVNRLDSLLPPDHPRTAYILLSASILMLDNRKILESEALARRALAVRENAMGADSPAAANARLNLITVLLAQEKFEEALALSEYSYKVLSEAKGNTADDVFTLRSNIALAKFGVGNMDAAIGEQKKLLDEQILAFPAGNEAINKNREILATMLAKAGKWQAAQALLDELQQSRTGEVGDKQRNYLTFEALRALAEIKNGALQAGVARLGTVRAGLDGFWQSEIFGEASTGKENVGMKRGYGWAVVAAVAADNPELAFAFAQRYGFGAADRAALRAALRDMTDDPQATLAMRARQDMVEERSRAMDEFYRKTASGDSAAATEVARRIAALTGQIEAQALGSTADKAQTELPVRLDYSLADVKARLADGEALLMTLETELGPQILAISNDQIAISPAAVSSQEIANLVSDVRGQITDHETSKASFDRSSASRLYAGLFNAKILQILNEKSLVNVVARGNMAKLPFALLSEPGQNKEPDRWLIEKFALAYPVGIAGFMTGSEGQQTEQLTDFFGIGAPLGENFQQIAALADKSGNVAYRGTNNVQKLAELPPLDFAQDELDRIASAVDVQHKTVLTGRAATEKAVRALDLSKAKIVTFATHGLMAGELNGVDEATLVLSAPAEGTADLENDGLLTASEISKLPIDAEWVVLSACNSASGERSNDDALSGLAQAFLYAGANSLLVSHWRLRDDTAAQLTVDTFRNVSAGMAKAEALRQAQLKLMADKSVPNSSHPAAWAPFILVGQ